MRPLLAYNGYSSGGAKAFSLTPFSYTQIGQNVGSVESGTVQHIFWSGRYKIVQLGNTIWVVHAGTIKRLNSDGTWTTIITLPNYVNDYHYTSQLFLNNIDGIYYLSCIYSSASSTTTTTYIRGLSFNITTGTVVASSEFAIQGSVTSLGGPDGSTIGNAVKLGSSIYLTSNSNGSANTARLISFNILTATFSNTNLLTSSNTIVPSDICIWNNEIWVSVYSTNYTLYKLVGNTLVSQVTGIGSTAPTGGHRSCLFTDNSGNLYLIAMLSASNAWACYRITSGLVVTDITSTVLSGFTSQDVDSRWSFFIDQHNMTNSPEYYLMFKGDYQGGAVSFYRWNGESSQITFVGSAGENDSRVGICTPFLGGGEQMYSTGEMNIQIEGALEPASTPGNTLARYRIYESSAFPSGTLCQVKLHYSRGIKAAVTPCRLTNPTPYGSMLDSYTITNVVSGSGNLHTIEWRTSADNISTGEGVTLIAQVSGIYNG